MRRLAMVLAALAGITTLVIYAVAAPVDAHELDDYTYDCDGFTANFVSFPQGTTYVVVGVNGVPLEQAQEIVGPDDSIEQPWSAFGWDTSEGGDFVVEFNWSLNGQGFSAGFTFDADSCIPVETTTTTTEPEETTTTAPEVTTTTTEPEETTTTVPEVTTTVPNDTTTVPCPTGEQPPIEDGGNCPPEQPPITQPPAPPTLPRTGAGNGLLAMIALGLIATGMVFKAAQRKQAAA